MGAVAPSRGNEGICKLVSTEGNVFGTALAARGKALPGEAGKACADAGGIDLPVSGLVCSPSNGLMPKIVFNATLGCVFTDNPYICLRINRAFWPDIAFYKI